MHCSQTDLPPGRKDDSAKIDPTLVTVDCARALLAVAEVCQWAITKKQPEPYKRGSWLGVEGARYTAAQARHELDLAKGKTYDDETGLLQLQHIATNALFRLEIALREREALEARAKTLTVRGS